MASCSGEVTGAAAPGPVVGPHEYPRKWTEQGILQNLLMRASDEVRQGGEDVGQNQQELQRPKRC